MDWNSAFGPLLLLATVGAANVVCMLGAAAVADLWNRIRPAPPKVHTAG